MLKSYSHNNLKKERCVEATKRPFLSLIDSRGPARSVSGSDWAWTDADHLELNGYVAQDKHNDQDYGDQDYAARVPQAKSRHCDRSDAPQDRRQQLDSRFLNTFPSWNSAPSCRISLLRPRLSKTGGDTNAATTELFSLLLNQFLRDWCRISHRCDGAILFSSTASRTVTDVEPYTPSAKAIR